MAWFPVGLRTIVRTEGAWTGPKASVAVVCQGTTARGPIGIPYAESRSGSQPSGASSNPAKSKAGETVHPTSVQSPSDPAACHAPGSTTASDDLVGVHQGRMGRPALGDPGSGEAAPKGLGTSCYTRHLTARTERSSVSTATERARDGASRAGPETRRLLASRAGDAR